MRPLPPGLRAGEVCDARGPRTRHKATPGPEGNWATSTPLQSLYLMNAPFMHEQSALVAERIIRETQTDQAGIDWAYRMIFGRHAGAEELKVGRQFLAKAVDAVAAGKEIDDNADLERDAWAACVRSMFASNAFLYVD